MKVGDRVIYRDEPAHIVGFFNTRHQGWVLIERADGSRSYAQPKELHLIKDKEPQ